MTATTRRFERYVALGDSSTEGLLDPDGTGGWRGWANRLAERLAAAQGSVLYANLAVRGKRTRQVLAEQLPAALVMRPDLATVFAGTNDVVGRGFDSAAFGSDLERIQAPLVDGGATVLTFTLPDLAPVMPLARRLTPRVLALNEAMRDACASSGATLVDLASFPVAVDARLWSEDRLHANALGHARIAAALAHALGLPGSDASWSEPLPPLPAPTLAQRLAAELSWLARHLLPWAWLHLQRRSSGDGHGPKRPALEELLPAPDRERLRPDGAQSAPYGRTGSTSA